MFDQQKTIKSIALKTLFVFLASCMPAKDMNVVYPTTSPNIIFPTKQIKRITQVGPTPTETSVTKQIDNDKSPKSTMATHPLYPDEVSVAIRDLAKRLNVDISQILIIKAYPDEFPISNLGCPGGKEEPQPMPAIVSGIVIKLGFDREQYIYHARRTQVVYCGRN
jgi:hypothetical protein